MRHLPAVLRCAAICACLTLTIPAPARSETHLHLGETATVMVAPDELAASLRVDVTTATARDAQARINTVMQDALARSRQVAGVTASSGAYGVWRSGPTAQDRTERWQASQTLNLTSHDGPALLTLVGDLQQKGLAVSSLGWRLSAETERKAHQEATRKALAALRGRVEEAADLLNLRFDQFKDVRLDSAAPQPVFRGMPTQMAMAASSAPPPTAAPEDVPVSATAEADAILLPR